jgi:flavodoxin
MKTLVAFYSRDGSTRKAAHAIADTLGCEIDEIIDETNRSGPVAYLKACKDAMTGKETVIKFKADPSLYDVVIVGSPIWAFTVVPAIRTYLAQNTSKIKKTAFFATFGGSGGKKAFTEMEKTSGKKPLAVFELAQAEVASGDYGAKLKAFIDELNKSA